MIDTNFFFESKELFFDVWMDGRWVGMTTGDTAEEARSFLKESWPNIEPQKLIMTPFYGPGTSNETYEALTGQRPLTINSKAEN